MSHANSLLRRFCVCGLEVSLLLLSAAPAVCQSAAPVTAQGQTETSADPIRELQEQVRELRAAVGELRSEAAQYRAETLELRRELQAARVQLASSSSQSQQTAPGQYGAAPPAPPAGKSGFAEERAVSSSIEDRVARLEEESQLQGSRIKEQNQTKVESASKYRVRLSGIVLLNLFSNRGTVDNQDVPTVALAPSALSSSGNFGGTLRQSEIGLEVFGPRLAGARTSGDVQFDFAGGFPNTVDGVSSGLVRLRTGTMRLDWSHTSVVAGQDNVFFSPLSPTSFASLAVPALGYAGNLWSWVPQVRVEHTFDLSRSSSVMIQGGILDNLTGQQPFYQSQRVPQAGERSSQPGYGARVAWTHSVFGLPLTAGIGGYYSRQDWGFNRHVDGWAGTADWDLPLGRRFSLSGEFYRGRALGGLGGGIGRSVLFSDSPTDPTALVHGIDTVGGWSQLKYKASSRWEFNGAFGLDNALADNLRAFPYSQNYYVANLARNQGSFVNAIYRPRSNLLFSLEYRRLRTFPLSGASNTADQADMMMGVLF